MFILVMSQNINHGSPLVPYIQTNPKKKLPNESDESARSTKKSFWKTTKSQIQPISGELAP